MTLQPLPLAVYIHWPYCARICPYCDFNVVRDRGRSEEQADLVDAIAADLRHQSELIGPRRLVSVFFGGGTPSLMRPQWLKRLIQACRDLWPASPDLEVSLEANPAQASRQQFSDMAAAGINRLSLGVQSFDDAALRFLGRDHDAAQGLAAIKAAQAMMPRVSADLIYARPGQDARSWAAELRRLADLGVEHISPYQLTIEAGTAFERAARRGSLQLSHPDLAAELYEVTQAVLQDEGFEAYEVSNHGRGLAARSRHNLAYWRGEDYLGVGPGAHGRLTLEGRRTATVAARRVGDYVARVRQAGAGWDLREVLSEAHAAEERLLMGLRTVEGVPFTDLRPIGLGRAHPSILTFADLGLLRADDERLFATAAGRLVLDRLTLELCAGAQRQAA